MFPVGTLLINLIGSFAIGFFGGASARWFPAGTELFLFLTAGLCGGFTTFSAFSSETVALIEKGRLLLAGAYAAGSVVLCLVGVVLGKAAARGALRLFGV